MCGPWLQREHGEKLPWQRTATRTGNPTTPRSLSGLNKTWTSISRRATTLPNPMLGPNCPRSQDRQKPKYPSMSAVDIVAVLDYKNHRRLTFQSSTPHMTEQTKPTANPTPVIDHMRPPIRKSNKHKQPAPCQGSVVAE